LILFDAVRFSLPCIFFLCPDVGEINSNPLI
jgi:hypothetical protein